MKTIAIIFCSAFMFCVISEAQITNIIEAAQDGDLGAVQALVTTNAACVNAQDADGSTPLLWAVRSDKIEVAKFLISKGADPTITNKNGVSAIMMAKALGKLEVLGLKESKSTTKTVKTTSHPLDVPTNEVLICSRGTGILRSLDSTGLLLESNNISLPLIPLDSLSDDDLRALLECKQAYSTLTQFGTMYYQHSEEGAPYEQAIRDAWMSGTSLRDKIQTRLNIVNDMRIYNKGMDIAQNHVNHYGNILSTILAKHTDYQGGIDTYGVETDPLQSKMKENDVALAKVQPQIDACEARLSQVGITTPNAQQDASSRIFGKIPPIVMRSEVDEDRMNAR